MFEIRGLGVALTIFLLIYACASLLVSALWEVPALMVKEYSSKQIAKVLFQLRVLPFCLASLFTLGVTLPSFWWLEPRDSGESIGTLPVALGFGCLFVLLVGGWQAFLAHKETGRLVTKWLESASRMAVKGCDAKVPIFETADDSPILTVAGVRWQRVLISKRTLSRLNAAELQGALRHEMAHVHAYDNFKRLIYRILPFPGMARLEHAWAEASEMAADDAAVSSRQNALDLASALVKISRLAPVRHPELTSGLLHSSTALAQRIERLCNWSEPTCAKRTVGWWAVPSSCIAFLALAGLYSHLLVGVHQVTEWLVR